MTGKTGPKGGGGREPGSNPGDEAAPGTPGTGEAVCPACGGSGRRGGEPCGSCGGTGRIIEGIGGA
jgi:DnaJ-class molecular chaperone